MDDLPEETLYQRVERISRGVALLGMARPRGLGCTCDHLVIKYYSRGCLAFLAARSGAIILPKEREIDTIRSPRGHCGEPSRGTERRTRR